MKFAFTSKFKAIKNSCSKLVITSAVGWEAQLRRMRNCRVFLNDGVGVLLFVSASKGEGKSLVVTIPPIRVLFPAGLMS